MIPRRNRERPAGRGDSTREVLPRVLIVHDAERTELQYFEGIKNACNNPRVTIHFADISGKDPLKLVEEAVRHKSESLQRAKDERDNNQQYEQVWCVLDHDERPQIPQAKMMAQKAGIQLALSTPCFELWLLLHFRDPPGLTDAKSLNAMLRKESPKGYNIKKHVDFEYFKDHVQRAVDGAIKLDALAMKLGEPDRNPSTAVYRLVEQIQKT